MTPDELDSIKKRYEVARLSSNPKFLFESHKDILSLIAEVKRLHSCNEHLEEEGYKFVTGHLENRI